MYSQLSSSAHSLRHLNFTRSVFVSGAAFVAAFGAHGCCWWWYFLNRLPLALASIFFKLYQEIKKEVKYSLYFQIYCLVAQICSFSSREQVYFSQKFTLDSAVYVTINKQCILLL